MGECHDASKGTLRDWTVYDQFGRNNTNEPVNEGAEIIVRRLWGWLYRLDTLYCIRAVEKSLSDDMTVLEPVEVSQSLQCYPDQNYPTPA